MLNELEKKILEISSDIFMSRKKLIQLNHLRSILLKRRLQLNSSSSFPKKKNLLQSLEVKKEKTVVKNEFKAKFKHFPSSIRECNNSIYLYNKNSLNLVPHTTIYSMKIIKSFFSLYNKSLEKVVRTKRLLLRFKRLSSNKIYLSDGEFKHSNNKVLINIYVYNKQRYNYLSKLKYMYLKRIFTRSGFNEQLILLLNSVHSKTLNSIRNVNKNKYLLIRVLDVLEKNEIYKINKFKSLSYYSELFHKKVLNLTMKKIRLFFMYKQLIYINKSKLNYTYLSLLSKYLENLYNKNVEFNLVNLRRFYLNSDILSESIRLKITRNKNRMRRIFNKLKDKIKIREKKLFLNENFSSNNELKVSKKNQKLLVFNNLKYRYVTGFRLEAKGRLSKRYTASRSVYKFKYKGNLLDMHSSHKGLSSVILRGNLKPNIQHTKLNSKTRIGSFGIKG